MNFRLWLKNALLTGLTMWLIAGIWHEVVMAHFYAGSTGHAEHQGTGIILIAYLVLALIMAYLFPHLDRGGSPLREGLRFGIAIGILWVFPHELAMAAAHGEPLGYVFKNGAWHMIEQGLGGWVLVALYRRASTPRETT